jgi:hypothetical protein
LRGQLADAAVAEHRRRFAEQVAELLDRDRLHVMLREVCLDEFGERKPPCDPPLSPNPLQLAFERVTRVLLRGEPATLHALRAAPARAEAIRPQPLAAGPATRQFECLSLLHHR